MRRRDTATLSELESLRARLEEAEQTLEAIRSGRVDALIVSSPDRLATDPVFQTELENALERAVILCDSGTIGPELRRAPHILHGGPCGSAAQIQMSSLGGDMGRLALPFARGGGRLRLFLRIWMNGLLGKRLIDTPTCPAIMSLGIADGSNIA